LSSPDTWKQEPSIQHPLSTPGVLCPELCGETIQEGTLKGLEQGGHMEAAPDRLNLDFSGARPGRSGTLRLWASSMPEIVAGFGRAEQA